jgi:hypothetical protein
VKPKLWWSPHPLLDARKEDHHVTVEKSAALHDQRRSHVLHRHSPKVALTSNPPRDAASFVHHIIALEGIGWHIIALRPSAFDDESPLWHVEIMRFDHGASVAVWEVDLDVAFAELVRYASTDAAEAR